MTWQRHDQRLLPASQPATSEAEADAVAAPPASGSRWSRGARRVGGGIRRAVPFASGVAAVLVALLIYGALVPGPTPLTQQDVKQQVAQALASATPGPALSALAYAAVEPSLVVVQTQGVDSTWHEEADSSLGSGVVVDAQGDILTCLHVVAGATAIQLTFADGTKSAAKVMSTQPDDDIAVLQATQPPATIVPATLGRAGGIGDPAYVIGNPFGLAGSESAGVISGLNRSFKLPTTGTTLSGPDPGSMPPSTRAIRGGPLVNSAGDVIGIVVALVNPTPNDVFIGIGLAIPIATAGGAAGLPSY